MSFGNLDIKDLKWGAGQVQSVWLGPAEVWSKFNPLAVPLTLTANTAGSVVSLTAVGSPAWTGSYSTDGTTWQTYTLGTSITLSNIGDKVCFKGVQSAAFDINNYLHFTMTGSIAASGNCMSLWCGDNFATATAIPYIFAGVYLFTDCISLTSTPLLPATEITAACYYGAFQNCSALTTPPVLPATTIPAYAYSNMFMGCSALTTAPALPATNLADYCYWGMFAECLALTTIPVNLLPATTLAANCYGNMFGNCPALQTAPALPATTLATACYDYMFRACTSLIVSDTSGTGYAKAWRIPTSGTFTGTTYAQGSMFIGCATGSGRSSDDMAGTVGSSFTYYTQNTPIS